MSTKTLYVVMRAITWQAVEIGVHPLSAPLNGPQRFIPVFDTQEQAIAWAEDGDVIAPIHAHALPVPEAQS